VESGPAETLLRLLADAELRCAVARATGEPGRVEGARAGNGRRPAGWAQLAGAAEVAAGLGGDLPAGEVTRLVASTLAAAGAIGHDFAAATVDDLDGALAARGITTARPDRGPGMPAWPLLTPRPAAGEPVRIDGGVPAPHGEARREPVAARGQGELLAEAAAAGLLATALMPIPSARGAVASAEAEARGVGSVVAVLLALGLLPAGSPALRRLATLGERLGIGFPVPASGLAQPAGSLPEPWQAVLADRGRRDGPAAITRIAAALPELDGARIALTALESAPDHALLRLLAVGWDPPGFDLRAFTGAGEPPLSWWARDSAGRWHTASGGSWGRHGNRQWAGMLRLGPAASSGCHLAGTDYHRQVRTLAHYAAAPLAC
jgi:hypothetical protein